MKVGDYVFIIGKYVPDATAPYVLVEGKITHIKHRQYVVYNNTGRWAFSGRHIGKCVFMTREEAEKALKERQCDGK